MANTTELERARPVILVTDYGYENKVKAEKESFAESLYRIIKSYQQPTEV
jgi:hypothetical protein